MLIIFRYLAGEVLKSMLAVALVVLVIAVGWRFSGYLTDAAEGLLMREVLVWVLLYRAAGMLELILPLSFFIGIVIAYSRLGADSEMMVLRACGVGPPQLLLMTGILALGVACLAAFFSLWLKPAGETRLHRLLTDQRNITEFDTLVPGRFQKVRTGGRVTYAADLDRTEGRLSGVFISSLAPGGGADELLVAASGRQRLDAESGSRFLVLQDGYRYSGRPGAADFQVVRYREYGRLLGRQVVAAEIVGPQQLSTGELLGANSPLQLAELQWRVSMVLMVPLVALLALAFTGAHPRQGGAVRLLPGVGVCILYVLLLSSTRAAVEKSQIAAFPGLYAVHALMLALALLLYGGRRLYGGLFFAYLAHLLSLALAPLARLTKAFRAHAET